MGLVKRCHVKGLVLSIVLGLMGFILSFWMPLLGGVTYALLLGIFVSNVLPLQEGYKPGIKFSEKTILSLAIVLIGFNLDIQSLSQISYQTMGLVVLGASAAILLAWVVGAAFRLRPDQRLLIGFGTAICGSSAIAACTKVLVCFVVRPTGSTKPLMPELVERTRKRRCYSAMFIRASNPRSSGGGPST